MIVELTLTTDDGKPFLMDGCMASLYLQDAKEGTEVRIVSEIKANKVIYHIPTAESKEIK